MSYRRPYRGTQPDYLFPPYASTVKRAPSQPLVVLPHTLSELTAPVFGYSDINPDDNDLTRQHKGEPLGERIVVSGRVLDENSRPLEGLLIEIWQANAAGRYNHRVDQHDAPLDPNFTGAGRAITNGEGRYRFVTIRPGEYPWRNHYNAWRPAHIHFSLFGRRSSRVSSPRCIFPAIRCSNTTRCSPACRTKKRNRLISLFDWETTIPEHALGYRFDIVLRGREATPMERPR